MEEAEGHLPQLGGLQPDAMLGRKNAHCFSDVLEALTNDLETLRAGFSALFKEAVNMAVSNFDNFQLRMENKQWQGGRALSLRRP